MNSEKKLNTKLHKSNKKTISFNSNGDLKKLKDVHTGTQIITMKRFENCEMDDVRQMTEKMIR